jgi:hypothetical protein
LGKQSSISGTATSYGGGGGSGVTGASDGNAIYRIPGYGGTGNATKTFGGTINCSGTTLNVTAVSFGAIYVGMVIQINLSTTRTITAFGSGSGGIGSYTTNVNQTVASTSACSGVYAGTPSIGTGGGGNGGYNVAGTSGAANTGGGGGGGGYDGGSTKVGGNGGSGVVIIRYPV